MLEIPIRQRSFVALIDDCDSVLMESTWYAVDTRKNRTPYVSRQIRKPCGRFTTELMHRVIMKAGPHQAVDHIDGNGLNNCRSNLRFATKAENAQNRGKPVFKAGCSSKYKGVTFDKVHRKWYAYINVYKKRKFLGYHADEHLCAKAYNAAAAKYFGEHACLNIVVE